MLIADRVVPNVLLTDWNPKYMRANGAYLHRRLKIADLHIR